MLTSDPCRIWPQCSSPCLRLDERTFINLPTIRQLHGRLLPRSAKLARLLSAGDHSSKDLSEGDDAALLVDVGGAMGKDLREFLTSLSNVKGELILQDQEEPIGRAQKAGLAKKPIKAMANDFFAPEPIKGDGKTCANFPPPTEKKITTYVLTEHRVTPGARAHYLNSACTFPEREIPLL